MLEMTKKTMTPAVLMILVVAVLLSFPLFSSISATNNETRQVFIDGAIDPIVAAYLMSEIDLAEAADSRALIVVMDTPGGLDISMRTIIKKIMASKVPIIVYTAPTGARAASAGAIISLSANIASMAPGTTIGAAHPVNLGGSDVNKVMAKKVENDAAAFVRGIAKQRGRNIKWAEDAVRKSVSATAAEAKELDVIDFVADSTQDLLNKADGRIVMINGKARKLKLKGTRLIERPMSFRQKLLHGLIDPNVVFLLITLGTYGIIYELANPGFGFAGIGGAMVLILAFYGLQTLPINLAGLLLIIFAFILFVAEAFTPTFGVLSAGGLMAFILGSVILIDAPRPQLAVSAWVISPVAVLTLGFVVFMVRSAWLAHRRPSISGKAGMIGLSGKVSEALNPAGQVLVHGEVWSALAVDPPVKVGQEIEVVAIEGLKLTVKKRSSGENEEE